LAKLINDPEMGHDLRETMASLESVSRKIDEGQGTLGKLINEDTAALELEKALEGINRILDKQDQFRTSVDFTSEYLARHGDTKSYLTLRLQPSEDKYYLLSLVDSPQGRREKTETFTERWVNGERTTIREIEDKYRQSKITFSAQLAKRWDNLVLRGGLFENTGGVGLDYYLWDDRLQLLFEAFDFDPDDNPHLKAGAKLYFLRNFYASLGMDDFARSDRSSFYAGLGFYFTDEDLKYLFTSVPLPTN
jgi:phospholipid/cholesterol/gamma-HCH transport system substrate-binding protein